MIYLDFAKAFDKCDHGVILHKLKALGIIGKIGVWIYAFLTNRQQVVGIQGVLSQKEWVTSGVPQGSVLGPLLFAILISDITLNITPSLLLSYADDTKIYKGISVEEDEEALQNDLYRVYRWSEDNNQEFNEKKFESMRFSFNDDESIYFNPEGDIIVNHPMVKDLGVLITDDCSFNKHIVTMTTKGRKLAGWILRTFDCREHPFHANTLEI